MKRKGEAVFAASFFVRRRKVSNAYGKTDAMQSSPQSQNDALAAFCIGRKNEQSVVRENATHMDNKTTCIVTLSECGIEPLRQRTMKQPARVELPRMA